MKKIVVVIMFAFLICFGMVSGAMAAPFWDLIPTGQYGPVSVGDTFDLEVWLVNPDDESFKTSIYSFCVDYDENEIDWTGTYTNTPPGRLIADYLGNPYDGDYPSGSGNMMVINFNAASLTEQATIEANSSYLVGTFQFKVNTVMSWDGLSDADIYYRPGIDGIGIDYGSGEKFYQIEAHPGPDVGVVPIPGTVILLGSGLVGLAGLRKRLARG